MRRVIGLAAASILGAGGLALLASFSGLSVSAMAALLAGADPLLLPVLILLSALSSLAAAERWHLVEIRLASDRPGAAPPGRLDCLVMTANGAFLGNFLPAPAATALCRGAGRIGRGNGAVRRSLASTIFEQLFDLALALALTAATLAAAAGSSARDAWWWFAPAALAGMFGIVEAAFACARRLSRRSARVRALGGVAALLARPDVVPLLQAGLARELIALSCIRFGLLVLTAMASAAALHLDIAGWRLAAALPPALIAAAFPLTPAGLGTADWTVTAFLAFFGISVSVAAQWVIGHRLLVAAASLFPAAVLAILRVCVRSPLSEALPSGLGGRVR